MSEGKKNPHVIWIGIDPNLLLAGLDTKALFGCDNYLKFSLHPVQEEQYEEKVVPNLEDDVNEEVSSGEDDFDDSMQFLQEAENDNCADDDSEQRIQTGAKTEAIDESRSRPKQRRDHSKKNPNLFCASCKKTFCNETSFKRHITKNDCRERDENYVQPCNRSTICEACGQTFRDRSGMKKHYKVHHMGQKDHKCDQCENEYASKVHLKRHIEAAHMDVNFFCDICNTEFKTSVDLKEHEKREHSGIAIQCPKCNKKFIQRRNLEVHLVNGICEAERVKQMKKMKKLKRMKEIPCPVCQKILTSNYKLKRHLEGVHY